MFHKKFFYMVDFSLCGFGFVMIFSSISLDLNILRCIDVILTKIVVF